MGLSRPRSAELGTRGEHAGAAARIAAAKDDLCTGGSEIVDRNGSRVRAANRCPRPGARGARARARGRPHKTEKNFQWFDELDAGRGNEKLTRRLETDDELKAVVYDLMLDVLDSGAQIRNLYRVVNDARPRACCSRPTRSWTASPTGRSTW
jgi:hypothetical protein